MAGVQREKEKHECMSPAVSCSRLRQVQSLLRGSDKTRLDGILCSLGIDSRYNPGCSELANYLFFGLYNQNHLDLELSDFPEELLDDVIVLIKAESVHLYCNPVNYRSLLPFISHWRNLHIHCMTEVEYEDEESAEEFKISSFVNMVQDCSRIGVPYSSQGHAQKFDMFVVEKWPIIQAFALEGIGGGGFFTMKHKLVDVSEELWPIYSKVDPVSLEVLLTEDLVSFEKQWASFFSNFDIESHSSIMELSEAQAGEPFRTYFSHGLISSHITDKSKSRQPFVLFGSHSTREDLESYCFTFPSEGHQVRNTGSQGTAAKHMVVQCVSPKGPLSCARTYFFGTTHIPCLGHDNDNEPWNKTELRFLSQLYEATVQAVLAGIKSYCCTSSVAMAQDTAEKTFQLTLDTYGLTHYKDALGSKAAFDIKAVNNEGRVIPLENVESGFFVKTASMVVYDIPDPLAMGRSLGSVLFSDSFLESRVSVQGQDGAVSCDSCFTILTAVIPRYVSWLVEESDVKHSEQIQQQLKEDEDTCLGKPLSLDGTALVFSGNQLSAPEEGKIAFFSEGIFFVHPRYGSVTLSKNLISALKFYDGDSSSSVATLFLEYELSLLSLVPFQLQSSSRCLAFGLQHKSKSYRTFYSKVLLAWQKQTPESGLVLEMVGKEQLVPEEWSMFSKLQRLCECRALLAAERASHLTAASAALPELDRFLQHFALSSVGPEPIPHSHLETLFSNREPADHHYDQTEKIVMTIITGLPGSSKDALCNFLINLNKGYGRWVLYPPAPESSESFSRAHLQRYLSSLLEGQRRGACHSAMVRCRLLVLTPGYTDVVDVVQAVLTHPDPRTRDAFRVGAITACVDPFSSYMEHRFVFPKLLEQCSQGLVSNVVFTGLAREQTHPLLKQLQLLVRAANPTAAFILAEKGAVTRNEDMDLILSESSFSELSMLGVRYLLYPGLSEGKFNSGTMSPTMTHYCLLFSRPLDKPRFVTRCKELKSFLRPAPFSGNVYNIRGQVIFSESDQLTEVSYNTVSGSLGLVPTQQVNAPPGQSPDINRSASCCFLQFYGVDLTLDGLKDWLRQCTKQKAVKKAMKTKTMLTLQEIREIHVERHLDPLPAGYFYNGNQFVNFFGEKMNFHPLMEQFVEEYVEEANKGIESFNFQLEQQVHRDLFDP